MKYVQPYGIQDPDAPYINGDPSIGRQGSIPPAAAFEHPMRELVNIISKSKLTPDANDLLQATKGIRSQRLNYAVDTGSVNNLSVAYDPPIGTYTVGLLLRVKIAQTNTGPSTIDAGGGRVSIRTMHGAGTAPGDLPGGGIVDLAYDGTMFQMINFFGQPGAGGGGGPSTSYFVNIPYANDVGSVNIIDATFPTLGGDSPAYTLKAGDPFLVKIANTNTGATIARFRTPEGSLGDKPVRANGGGATAALIQGDLTVGDVVLFIYDGTQFWIQPNPLISADLTLNVPTPYATVEAALLSIRRKIIAQNATVTVLLAQGGGPITGYGGATGCYAPFEINHANADRIIVRGTMKIPGNLTAANFRAIGSDAANRAADSAVNMGMLRSRYGTEIAVRAADGYKGCVSNVGPGMPTIADMLLTGPNYDSGQPVAGWTGVNMGGGRSLWCSNVSAWGLDIGFYGGGVVLCSYCFASGCFRHGMLMTAQALGSWAYSGAFGNGGFGIICNQNSWIGTYSSWCNYNASAGCGPGDNSQMTFHTSQAWGNGAPGGPGTYPALDITCGPMSYLIVLNSNAGGGFQFASPTPGYMSAYGALITVSY